MTETEKAWLAGIIDGEGAIYCRLPKQFKVMVEVKMTCFETVEAIHGLFPGCFTKGYLSKNSLGKKPQWKWALCTSKAYEFLKLISPYLRTKRIIAAHAIVLAARPMTRTRQEYCILARTMKELQA